MVNRELLPHEVEQLIAFEKHGITDAGSTLSHELARILCGKGIACRMDGGGYALTIEGQKLADLWHVVFRNMRLETPR